MMTIQEVTMVLVTLSGPREKRVSALSSMIGLGERRKRKPPRRRTANPTVIAIALGFRTRCLPRLRVSLQTGRPLEGDSLRRKPPPDPGRVQGTRRGGPDQTPYPAKPRRPRRRRCR